MVILPSSIEPIDPSNPDIHPDPIVPTSWNDLFQIEGDEKNSTNPGVVNLAVGSDGRLYSNSPTTPPAPVVIPRVSVEGAEWVFSGTFSVTDADTVAWGAGTLTTEDGHTYSIGAGNTGNMAAKTYIYFDVDVSTTAFQTTTTAGNSVGSGKILIAIAKNGTGEATYMVLNDIQNNIDAANIVANSITANELATSITYAGSIIIDSAGLIRSGQTAYDTGTGWWIGNDGGTPKLSIGVSTGQKITWNGTTLQIRGNSKNEKSYTAGENISQGESVFLASGKEVDSTNGSTPTGTVGDAISNTVWLGRDVSTAAGNVSLVAVQVLFEDFSGSPDGNIVVGIRSTADRSGADLKTQTFPVTGIVADAAFDFEFTTPFTVSPSTSYFVYVGRSGSTQGTVTVEADNTAGNQSYASSDAGDNFSAGPDNRRRHIKLLCSNHNIGKVYKTDASTTGEIIDNFIGFASDAITSGNAGFVTIGGMAENVSDASMPGFYYLSDTAGDISLTPGSNSRKVGFSSGDTNVFITNLW